MLCSLEEKNMIKIIRNLYFKLFIEWKRFSFVLRIKMIRYLQIKNFFKQSCSSMKIICKELICDTACFFALITLKIHFFNGKELAYLFKSKNLFDP